MPVDIAYAIHHPITCFLFIEPAFITNPVDHFAPLILSCGYPIHFISPHPQRNLAGTFWTITMGIHWLGEPNAVLKPECSIGERAYGAHINNVPYKIII